MKTLRLFLLFSLVTCHLALAPAARGAQGIKDLTLTGNLTGTLSGGTLDLSPLTLTLPSTFVITGGSYSDPSWLTLSKAKVGLGNVENTTLSTWAGSSHLATGAGGLFGTAAYTPISAYEVPLTFSTGLTRTTNTVTVNTSQNIATLSNLTSNGVVTTGGGAGTLAVIGTSGTGSAVLADTPTLTGSPIIGGVTLSSNAATALNSITSVAGQPQIFSTGTFGPWLSAASLTGDATFSGGLLMTGSTGGMPSQGVVNAKGFKINGVDVGTSTSSYWNSGTGGINYTAGGVSLVGTTSGAAGSLLANSVTAAAATNLTLAGGSTSGNVLVETNASTLAATFTGANTTLAGALAVTNSATIGAPSSLVGIMSVRPIADGIFNFRAANLLGSFTGGAIDMLNDATNTVTNLTVRAALYHFLTGDAHFDSTTASTSTTTGSLINAGGFGNAGDLWNGGNINIAQSKSLTFNGANSTSAAILVNQPAMAGASQYGANILAGITSSATSDGVGIQTGVTTAGGAWTMVNGYGLLVQSLAKNNTAVTTNYGIRVLDQTAGATNYAIYTALGTVRFGDSLVVTKTSSTTPSSLTYASPTSVDVTLANVFTTTTVNATGSVTFNATAGGTAGQRVVFIITNDATSAKTITFGTNFVPNGTLTPSGTNKVATIEFISNGTSLYELCRTVLP